MGRGRQTFENEMFAEQLLKEARCSQQLNPGSKEIEKCNQTIFSVDQQLEVMAERLSSLPQTISPTPIYRQMEKLEGHKKAAEERLMKLREAGVVHDEPADMREFQKFLSVLVDWLRREDSPKIRMKIIRALVRKILITAEGFEIYFKVGEIYVKGFLNDFESGKKAKLQMTDFGQKNRAVDLDPSPNAPLDFSKNFRGLWFEYL